MKDEAEIITRGRWSVGRIGEGGDKGVVGVKIGDLRSTRCLRTKFETVSRRGL